MAKMIPSVIGDDTKSKAERKLFYKLQDMEDTDDWTVIHSVAIADHPTQTQGEADFVVVIPNGGVFVLEVKGGGISYREGRWTSTNKEGIHDIKNPVSEANEAMHAFAEYVKTKTLPIDPESHSLFGFGVVFPDSYIHGQLSIPDLDDAQIADEDDLLDMKKYLLGLAKFWKERKPSFVVLPDASTCKKIVKLFRPYFSSHVPLIKQIENVERQTITLTENQQVTFDGLRDNERCLVRGGAGTGKTLIAINLARNLANEGKRVAFFCYNKQLAEYLRANTDGDNLCCCGSLTEYMDETLKLYPEIDIDPDTHVSMSDYYNTVLPALFTECFIENDLEQFDYLIIDEAQDLMTEHYLEVLDIILKGGLDDGNWYFFMDADRQNIFHQGMTYEDIKALLKERKIYYVKYGLIVNCRNSISIIKEMDKLFGTNTHYPVAEEKGAPVVKKTYRRDKDQARMIADTVNKLLANGVKPESITILSPFRFENAAIARVSSDIPVSDNHTPGKVFFSTIAAFKGLENSVIIITDISDFAWEKDISQFYIAMTRARSALYIFLSETANRNLGKLRG